MNKKISKPNDEMEYFYGRLDEIRMSGHERFKARAHFARAEAITEAIASAWNAIVRLFKPLAAKPPRNTAPSAG